MKRILRHIRDWWPVVLFAVACLLVMSGMAMDEMGRLAR